MILVISPDGAPLRRAAIESITLRLESTCRGGDSERLVVAATAFDVAADSCGYSEVKLPYRGVGTRRSKTGGCPEETALVDSAGGAPSPGVSVLVEPAGGGCCCGCCCSSDNRYDSHEGDDEPCAGQTLPERKHVSAVRIQQGQSTKMKREKLRNGINKSIKNKKTRQN